MHISTIHKYNGFIKIARQNSFIDQGSIWITVNQITQPRSIALTLRAIDIIITRRSTTSEIYTGHIYRPGNSHDFNFAILRLIIQLRALVNIVSKKYPQLFDRKNTGPVTRRCNLVHRETIAKEFSTKLIISNEVVFSSEPRDRAYSTLGGNKKLPLSRAVSPLPVTISRIYSTFRVASLTRSLDPVSVSSSTHTAPQVSPVSVCCTPTKSSGESITSSFRSTVHLKGCRSNRQLSSVARRYRSPGI